MSHLESPDPSDRIARIFDDLICPQVPCFGQEMVAVHHQRCDEAAGSLAQAVLNPKDRQAIEALAEKFAKCVLRDAQQDRLIHPELVPVRMPPLEGRLIKGGEHPRHAFYTEIMNADGEWLVYADLRFSRYRAGPAAMRVLTADRPDANYQYDVILSPPAFAEDLARLRAQELALMYEVDSSYLLCRILQAVGSASGIADCWDLQPRWLREVRQAQHPTFELATGQGVFHIELQYDPETMQLWVPCRTLAPAARSGAAPSAPAAEAEPEGAPCLFDLERMELAYLAACKDGPDTVVRPPHTSKELAAVERLRAKVQDELAAPEGDPLLRAVLTLPRVIERPGQKREYTALVYCLDQEGRTAFVDQGKSIIFDQGPAVYHTTLSGRRSHGIVLQPMHSPEALGEELDLIQSQGVRLLSRYAELSLLLEEALALAEEAEERLDEMTYEDIKYIYVKRARTGPQIVIESFKATHCFAVRLHPVDFTFSLTRLN